MLDGTGPEYLRSDDLTSSWVDGSRDGSTYVAEAFLAREDVTTPRIGGSILSNDGEWFIAEIEQELVSDGDVWLDGTTLTMNLTMVFATISAAANIFSGRTLPIGDLD